MLEGVNDSSLDGLLHDCKPLEAHSSWPHHVVTLDQLMQQSLGSGKRLVRV